MSTKSRPLATFHVLHFCIALTLLFAGRGAFAAGLLIADNGDGGLLEIREHSVHVSINNGIAVTEATQVFRNTEARQVEALYTFPVPKNASVSGFSMFIGGKEMVGEVIEKQRAREIYDAYKRVRHDPGLLEQTDYRTFAMRVFPIAPLAEQKVRVTYYQELDFDNDWATYVYPLATSTQHFVTSQVTGTFTFEADVRSEIPIAAVESPSHPKKVEFTNESVHVWHARLQSKGADLNRDLVLSARLSRRHTGIDVITSKQGDEDGYFCLTLTAGEDLAPASDAGMDYVFLLDISGSMNDDEKLDLSRHSLGAFIDVLGAGDRFDLMTFNTQPIALFGKLAAADDPGKRQASEFLASRQARGGTLFRPALARAYGYAQAARPLNIVIFSDGLTEQDEREGLIRLLGQAPRGSRIFCIGVGNDIDRAMLQQIADETGGLAAFISQQDDFARQAGALRRKLQRPVATDISVDFSGIRVHDVEPAKLPALYYGVPLRVYGRYSGSGTAAVTLRAKVGDKPVEQSATVDLSADDGGNPEIERMWAMKKVNRLLNGPRGSRSSVIDEIAQLGEAYSIATEYTSFIVLENDAEFGRWRIARRNALRLARDREAEAMLASQLEAMTSTAPKDIGPEAANAAPIVNRPPAPTGNPPAMGAGRNRRDLNLGAPGGGGAIDPLGGGIVALLSAAALLMWRAAYVKPRPSASAGGLG